MANIKLIYLYSDAGNYKNYGEVVFDNPNGLLVEDLRILITSKLIDEQWFYAEDWNIPDLHFSKWDRDLDHGLHEFEGLAYTEEASNNNTSLDYFLKLIQKSNCEY